MRFAAIALAIVGLVATCTALLAAASGDARPALDPAMGATVDAGSVGGQRPKIQPGVYIVELAEEPLAGYAGGIPGLAATSPTVTGMKRLNAGSGSSRSYLAYLDGVQRRTMASIDRLLGRPVAVRFAYRYALNGFSLAISAGEAARVAAMPGVARVSPSVYMPLDTDVTPRLIGAPGVWDGSALGRRVGTMGEGIVVTGINMDHPSFAAVDKYGYEHLNPKGHYLGQCDPTNAHYDPKWVCNDKLIGVYSFIDEPPGNSFVPEDAGGHGSHTASTVAGNFVSVPLAGPTIMITREISGVAPHANIVAYDACGGSGCPNEATLAALDQAVADRVDVVNYSISTSRGSPWDQPVMQAFYRVRQAGIFAAVSAGNNGPGAATTGALPPWVTAVAAATHDRVLSNSLVDLSGGGMSSPGDLTGGSLTAGYGPAPIVYAGSGAYTNVSGAVDDGMCNQSFPAGTWHGEIVVCRRGQVARVTKAVNVQAGGAGGFVLDNTQAEGEELLFDGFAIPGLQLGYSAATRLEAWLAAGSGHSARITGTQAGLDASRADVVAGFSSRGPALAGQCCRRPDSGLEVGRLFGLLKPDITGPGVDVLAAVASPAGSTTPEFGRLSGTSMSGPHLAGAAALVLASRPEWTVAEAQSALMTTAITATVRKSDGVTPADPFDGGAGRVAVDRAVAAGLVLDATPGEMAAADPLEGGDVRQLNLASLADPFCMDTCSWTRVVSGTLDHAMTWTASVQAAEGTTMTLSITPSRFRVAPGRKQRLSIQADVDGCLPDQWEFATIVLMPDDPTLPTAHMPVAVRPVFVDIPAAHAIYTTQSSGSNALPGVRTSLPGPLRLDVSGLARGTASTFALVEDPSPGNPFDVVTGTRLITMTVPVPSERIVVEVTSSTAKDLDLFVGLDRNGDGLPQTDEQVCTSGGDSWTEYCEFGSSAPDQVYWAVIQNFTGSENQPDETTVVTGIVPPTDESNLTVTAPPEIVSGQPFDLRFDWSLPAMSPGDTWYGLVDVGSSADIRGDLGRIAVDVVVRPVAPTPTLAPTAVPTREPVSAVIWLPALVRGWPEGPPAGLLAPR